MSTEESSEIETGIKLSSLNTTILDPFLFLEGWGDPCNLFYSEWSRHQLIEVVRVLPDMSSSFCEEHGGSVSFPTVDNCAVDTSFSSFYDMHVFDYFGGFYHL